MIDLIIGIIFVIDYTGNLNDKYLRSTPIFCPKSNDVTKYIYCINLYYTSFF